MTLDFAVCRMPEVGEPAEERGIGEAGSPATGSQVAGGKEEPIFNHKDEAASFARSEPWPLYFTKGG
jgi:hypothetical protein